MVLPWFNESPLERFITISAILRVSKATNFIRCWHRVAWEFPRKRKKKTREKFESRFAARVFPELINFLSTIRKTVAIARHALSKDSAGCLHRTTASYTPAERRNARHLIPFVLFTRTRARSRNCPRCSPVYGIRYNVFRPLSIHGTHKHLSVYTHYHISTSMSLYLYLYLYISTHIYIYSYVDTSEFPPGRNSESLSRPL